MAHPCGGGGYLRTSADKPWVGLFIFGGVIMAKRFISTEMFDDEWFMDLSPEAKLLYVYLFVRCDHAGIISINWKLAEFQTGIKELKKSHNTLLKEFEDRLVNLGNDYYFLPKFIWFQYPGFPKSKVMQQQGAIKRLNEFDLFDEENQTLNKELVIYYSQMNGPGDNE